MKFFVGTVFVILLSACMGMGSSTDENHYYLVNNSNYTLTLDWHLARSTYRKQHMFAPGERLKFFESAVMPGGDGEIFASNLIAPQHMFDTAVITVSDTDPPLFIDIGISEAQWDYELSADDDNVKIHSFTFTVDDAMIAALEPAPQ